MTLLAVTFGASAFRIMGRAAEDLDPDTVVVRFAHFELEEGVREALKALSRDYESLHPGVRIRQIDIPERVYKQWITTQLIGEMAPDIVEIQAPYTRDGILGRFIRPITNELAEPNPYNGGTPLEGMAWRNTFIDGVSSNHATTNHILETFGVPYTVSTTRVYFNIKLLREITGKIEFPED